MKDNLIKTEDAMNQLGYNTVEKDGELNGNAVAVIDELGVRINANDVMIGTKIAEAWNKSKNIGCS